MNTTFSVKNITKETPIKQRIIGNGLALLVMALQPIISNASVDIISDKSKFWWSISLATIGVIGKVITMMFSDTSEDIQ